MTKGELKTIINKYSHRTHDDDDLNAIIDRVGVAIGRDAQLFEQDKSITFTALEAGYPLSNIPDWSIETSLQVADGSNNRPLQYMTPDQLELVTWNASHQPTFYTIKDQKIFIGPHADVEVTMQYQQRIPNPMDDSSTNDIMTKWPNTYVYGCVLEAGLQFQDDDLVNKFKPLYDEELAKLAAFADAQRLGSYTQIRAV